LPLALLALFVGYLLINAGIRNQHPLAEIVQAFGGAPPGPPGVSPGQPGSVSEPGQGINPATGGVAGGEYGPPSGEAAVQKFHAAVVAKFGDQLHSVGVCACRTIKPHSGGSSSQWSEHAWCNAEDWGGSAGAMARLMIFANLNRRKYKLVNIIPPGASINVVHVDFAPSHRGQTPPCAAAA